MHTQLYRTLDVNADRDCTAKTWWGCMEKTRHCFEHAKAATKVDTCRERYRTAKEAVRRARSSVAAVNR